VLGFLSVSTSRPGTRPLAGVVFQSRAGFSECLDPQYGAGLCNRGCFNPVLGFLSVSTVGLRAFEIPQIGFNPVLGFLSVSTSESFLNPVTCAICFNPVLGFLSVSTT